MHANTVKMNHHRLWCPSYRELIKDPSGLESMFINNWTQIASQMDPSSNKRSVKIMSEPIKEHSVRARFELTRGDLEKIKKYVLSKWELEEKTKPNFGSSKPATLYTFVASCAYVSVCIVEAFQQAQSVQKFCFGVAFDCRARSETPIPENYFGNCVTCRIVDSQPDDFIKEDGVVIVSEKILSTIKMLVKGGALNSVETMSSRFMAMARDLR